MDSISNFYDDLDLRYPEIAIAMQDINIFNPGKVKFIIPILTPNLDSTKIVELTEYQDSSNLQNDTSTSTVEVNNISINNYIEIYVPKELCAYMQSSIYIDNAAYMASTNVSLYYNEDTRRYTIKMNSSDLSYSNSVQYIPSGSKWIVVFIGGDITKPRIIGRYYDEEYNESYV